MLDRQTFYLGYDLDSASYKYGRIVGMFQGYGGLKTTGSSVTIDAVVAGSAPFSPVLVGDYVWLILLGGTVYKRRVATKPSNDQITVDVAVDLGTGISAWHFLPFRIGTTDEDGWHSVENRGRAWVELEFATITDAVDVSIEVRGRAPAAEPLQVFSASYPAATPVSKVIEVTELIGSVRVGVKAAGTFAGTDSLSAFLSGEQRG